MQHCPVPSHVSLSQIRPLVSLVAQKVLQSLPALIDILRHRNEVSKKALDVPRMLPHQYTILSRSLLSQHEHGRSGNAEYYLDVILSYCCAELESEDLGFSIMPFSLHQLMVSDDRSGMLSKLRKSVRDR